MTSYVLTCDPVTKVVEWKETTTGSESILKIGIATGVISWTTGSINPSTERILRLDGDTDVISWESG